jgi:ribosomal protein S18 acetylase RimI-like enzyme
MGILPHLTREAGTKGMRLYTGSENGAALALYGKCGYKNLGNDAVFMEKEW